MVDASMDVARPPGIMVRFLEWVDARPRSYSDAMDAWRTSCPRLSVWEDALDDGLVRVDPGQARGQSSAAVVLTGRGKSVLATAARG